MSITKNRPEISIARRLIVNNLFHEIGFGFGKKIRLQASSKLLNGVAALPIIEKQCEVMHQERVEGLCLVRANSLQSLTLRGSWRSVSGVEWREGVETSF